jgi:TRAP transporter TAXI family solute receptor
MNRAFYRGRVAVTFIGVVIALSMGCRGEGKVESEKKKISFGTGVVADAELNALSRGVVRAISKRVPEFNISARENPGGTTEAIQNINRYDFCGLSLDNAAQAYYGFHEWEGRAHPQLRLLWVMGMLPINFIVATNTGINSIYELNGKAVGSGEPGSMAEFKAMGLLKVLGIKPHWHRGSWEVQIDLYRKGKLVGLVKEGAPDTTLIECAERRPFSVLDISETDLNRANQHYSGTGLIFPMNLLRPGVYPRQEKILTTCGLMFGYFTRANVPAEVAYKLVGAAYAELWDLSKCYKPMSLDIIGFPKLTMEQGPFPLHPGAIKLYRGMKLEPPGRLIPPELR